MPTEPHKLLGQLVVGIHRNVFRKGESGDVVAIVSIRDQLCAVVIWPDGQAACWLLAKEGILWDVVRRDEPQGAQCHLLGYVPG